MTAAEYGQMLAEREGPISDETAAAAARILVGVETGQVAA